MKQWGPSVLDTDVVTNPQQLEPMEFEPKAITLSPILDYYTLSKQIRTLEENTVTGARVLELVGR